MKLTLVVMAAGMGSRYGGLKQLDAIGPHGETVMDYSIFDAIRAGFTKVVFIIRKDIEEQFRAVVGSRYVGKIAVEYAFQELDKLPDGFSLPTSRSKPWGTGHAVLCAAAVVHEPFVVINADDFYGAESYRLLAEFLTNKTAVDECKYCMCGFLLKNTLSENGTVARGICEITAGKLTAVTELTKIEPCSSGARNIETGAECALSGDEIISMNMWGFTPTVFAKLELLFREFLVANSNASTTEFYLPVAIDTLIRTNTAEVAALTTPEQWFGITYRQDRQLVTDRLTELVIAGKYPEQLFVEGQCEY
ncbi:MAG: sugar phosphate nucleotidyltransferase [Bacillota bacterium]